MLSGFTSSASPPVTEVIVSGWDAVAFPPEPQPDPIEPEQRVCKGVLTRGGDTFPNLADVDTRLENSIVRMYNGDEGDEENFVGYGLGKINWLNPIDDLAPIATWVIDLAYDAQSRLGGYSNDDITGWKYEYTYVEVDGIHCLWLGVIANDSPPSLTYLDSANLRAWGEADGEIETEARIIGLDFWDYEEED